jgi:hypothetical protein
MTNEQMRRRSETLVIALVGVKHAPIWWNSSNLAFDYVTPAMAFETDPTQVYNYLIKYAGGDYS